MAAAKDIFLSHMSAFRDAVHHESIVEREPNQRAENARARMMRNGLAVICFSILEDFFRLRAKEVLNHIGRTGIPFETLPEELRRILTVKALSAAVFQVRLLKPNRDEVVFAQEIAQQIASTSGSPFDACEVSFGYEASNLTATAIEAFLRSLNVDKPWETIGHVAARAGIGTLGLGARAAFENIARRRHEAAHDPQANVQPSDLKAAQLNALGLAFGFDAIASVAALNFKLLNSLVISGKEKIYQKNIKLLFVDQNGESKFGVRKEESKRYYRSFAQLQEARALSRELSLKSKEVCVIRGAQRTPTDWELGAL